VSTGAETPVDGRGRVATSLALTTRNRRASTPLAVQVVHIDPTRGRPLPSLRSSTLTPQAVVRPLTPVVHIDSTSGHLPPSLRSSTLTPQVVIRPSHSGRPPPGPRPSPRSPRSSDDTQQTSSCGRPERGGSARCDTRSTVAAVSLPTPLCARLRAPARIATRHPTQEVHQDSDKEGRWRPGTPFNQSPRGPDI
jgi:hypothetical protein